MPTNKISGKLAVFYPCRIKETARIKHAISTWRRRRKGQLRVLHNDHFPLTDLMDDRYIRDQMDTILNGIFNSNDECAPSATDCIMADYGENREGKQHSKELSIVVSRFNLAFDRHNTCYTVESANSNHVITKFLKGMLIFSLNLDNMVGCFIVNLHFDDYTIEDVIFLKHIFYKRYIVKIESLPLSRSNPCPYPYNCRYCGCLIPSCCIDDRTIQEVTLPQYVISQNHIPWRWLKWNIDFRARYSLLEIDSSFDYKSMYGLINADEGYDSVPNGKIIDSFFCNGIDSKTKDLSTREAYSYYVIGQNGLIINWHEGASTRIKAKNFFDDGRSASHHLDYEPPRWSSCIAGVGKGRFKTFLKAVELHYLVNTATTNEIEIRQQSHINPFIFLKRAYRLWEIIYEIDMNPYHTDDAIITEFGITSKVHALKDEYKSILNLTIGYATILIAIFTLIFTVAQLCR